MYVCISSSQTLNSAVLAKARMRAELGSDHTHKHLYTYCQDYHSMTFEPVDIQAEKKSQRYKIMEKFGGDEKLYFPDSPVT